MVMPDTRNPNAEGHPPSPPSKGGRAERRGDVIPSKGGKSEAHEALTFWLLLGQAKSNGKSALNNKRNE